jgi:hypothetical protein
VARYTPIAADSRRPGRPRPDVLLLSDSAANGYANYVLDDSCGLTPGRVGHAVVTALAVIVTFAAVQLWPAARDSRHADGVSGKDPER